MKPIGSKIRIFLLEETEFNSIHNFYFFSDNNLIEYNIHNMLDDCYDDLYNRLDDLSYLGFFNGKTEEHD
jgi:hypothetical protein